MNPQQPRQHRTLLPLAFVLTCSLALWHYPLTFGKKMPAGGDVTGFFLPLMASLQRSLSTSASLAWNPAWGFGFPQVAEGQTGYYYLPRRLLYRLLPLEAAYTAELLAHVVLGLLGAYLLARRLGASPVGAAIAGASYCGSGFFISHLAHQWAYCGAAWLPWAHLMAWNIRHGGRATAGAALAVVLALQLTAGHFQVALITWVSLLVVWPWIGCGGGLRRCATLASSFILAATLASVQLLPTWGLLRQARTPGFGQQYAGEFAVAPPLLLVNPVLPSAFHVVPAWRPVIWDPWHTSPEEALPYFGGAAALVLAALGVRRGPPPLRTLGLGLTILGLSLSVLPFLPLVRLILELPVFGQFRAPARWLVLAGLGIGLLAAAGATALHEQGSRRYLTWAIATVAVWATIAAVLVGALAGALGDAVKEHSRIAWQKLAGRLGPWQAPKPDPFTEGSPYPSAPLARLSGLGFSRWIRANDAQQQVTTRDVVLTEIVPPLVILGASLAALAACRSGRVALVCVVAEAGAAHLLAPIDYLPRLPISEQSPVLRRLAEPQQEGLPLRVVGLPANVPMLAGAAGVPGYRTLDLPGFAPDVWHPSAPLADPAALAWHNAAGVERYIVAVPNQQLPTLLDVLRREGIRPEVLSDPLLQRALYGLESVRRSFVIWSAAAKRGPVFAIEAADPVRPGWFLRGRQRRAASWWDWRRCRLTVDLSTPGPAWLLWTTPFHPAWRAKSQQGEWLRVEPSPERWLMVRLPRAGNWSIELTFDDPYQRAGKWSSVLGTVLMVAWLVRHVSRRRS